MNKSGETDLLLVGPSGVWVVEVKNRRVELSAHRNHWHFQKFDNYGNVVGKGLAIDGRGRNWGKQASEVAESLAWWLSHNQVDLPVRTAVVLVHPKASVKSGVNPSVDILTANRSDLIEAMNSDPTIFAPDVRDRVAQLVRRDHAHHNQQT